MSESIEDIIRSEGRKTRFRMNIVFLCLSALVVLLIIVIGRVGA